MATLTTLIPAYKKDYLAEVFLGLRRQVFKDFRIIVSDDSPDNEISQQIASGHFGRLLDGLAIEVVPGPRNARLNFLALLARWADSSPLVHLHLDDDVIFPDFYRQHVEAHASGRYSLSVSRRWVTQDDIRPVYGIELPRFVAESPLRVVPVSEQQLFSSTVPTCNNWLGEFSNMVLSAEAARAFPRAGREHMNYFGWPDVGLMLTVVQQAPLAYLRDHLSIFRQHAEQTTHHMHNQGGRASSMAWAAYALQAWHEGRITPEQAVHAITYTVRQCFERYGEGDEVINRFYHLIQQHGASLPRLHAAFEAFWLPFLASHPATAPAEPSVAAAPAAAREPALSAL